MDEGMTAQVYRMYNGERAEANYCFSIIAWDAGAKYVVPKQDASGQRVFNDERLQMITGGLSDLPTAAREWAILASYNAGWMMGLFEDEGNKSEFLDLLIEDEQEYADRTWEKYFG
jgi:hypothetical protein